MFNQYVKGVWDHRYIVLKFLACLSSRLKGYGIIDIVSPILNVFKQLVNGVVTGILFSNY